MPNVTQGWNTDLAALHSPSNSPMFGVNQGGHLENDESVVHQQKTNWWLAFTWDFISLLVAG